MIRRISEKIVNKMVVSNVIEKDEEPYYLYAMQVNIEKLIGYLIVALVALLTHEFFGIAAFSIFFIVLRKYTNGFHCKTSLACFVLTSATLFSVSIVVNTGLLNEKYYIVTIISAIIILIVGAVNSEEMSWSDEQLAYARKKTRQFTLIEVIAVTLFKLFNVPNKILTYCSCAMLIVSISCVIGWIGRRKYVIKEDAHCD